MRQPTPDQRSRTVTMLADPTIWPEYPFLWVIRQAGPHGGMPSVGYLVAGRERAKPVVGAPSAQRAARGVESFRVLNAGGGMPNQFADAVVAEYDNVNHFLGAGWVVA